MRAACGGLHTVQALCTPRVQELDKKVPNLPEILPTVAVLCASEVEKKLQTSVLSGRAISTHISVYDYLEQHAPHPDYDHDKDYSFRLLLVRKAQY